MNSLQLTAMRVAFLEKTAGLPRHLKNLMAKGEKGTNKYMRDAIDVHKAGAKGSKDAKYFKAYREARDPLATAASARGAHLQRMARRTRHNYLGTTTNKSGMLRYIDSLSRTSSKRGKADALWAATLTREKRSRLLNKLKRNYPDKYMEAAKDIIRKK